MKQNKKRRILRFCLGCGILLAAFWLSDYLNQDKKVSAPKSETEAPGKIALTFDDGPSIYTKGLLDGLKERNVRASFFLLGKNIQGKEDVVKQMYKDGHLIGNHTFNHVQLTQVSGQEARLEIEKTSNLIYEITGYYPNFVRPPFGAWREDLEYAVTMLPVLWSVDPLDWQLSSADEVVRRVEQCAGAGDIILLHDSEKSSVQAALRIVDDFLEKGYEFVTVEEMLLD